MWKWIFRLGLLIAAPGLFLMHLADKYGPKDLDHL